MRTNSDVLLRINQCLTVIVGTIVLGALCIACWQYGPGVAKCVHDFYHPPKHAQRQAENSKAMMQHVSNAKFEMSYEMRKWFDAQQAEFEANKRLGETYRAPPPRRP